MYTQLVTQGPNAVPYWEEPHAVERWAADATEIVRVLTCPWNRRREFIQDLLGWHTRGSGELLTRVRPDIHPYWSDTSGSSNSSSFTLRSSHSGSNSAKQLRRH